VFPANLATRNNFTDYHDTKWVSANSSKFFDIPYLVSYWRSLGVSVCLETEHFIANTSRMTKLDFCSDIVPSPATPLLKNNCNSAHLLNLTPDNFSSFIDLWLSRKGHRLNGSVALTIQTFWKILPTPEMHQADDNLMRVVRRSTMSLRFAITIACAGRAVFNQLKRRSARHLPVVGVHARLEQDWEHRTSNVPRSHSVLKRYGQRIRDMWRSPVTAYIAVGEIDEKRQTELEVWADTNFVRGWHTKLTLVGNIKINQFPLECLAALEACVLLHLDYFVGQAISSFDTFVCEIRSLIGKPSSLLYHYFDEFRPFVSTRDLCGDVRTAV